MMKPRNAVWPLNFIRARAYAAGIPQTIAIRVEPPAIRIEFSIYSPMGARVQISTKLDHRALMGRIVPSTEKISARLFRAVQNITK